MFQTHIYQPHLLKILPAVKTKQLNMKGEAHREKNITTVKPLI